MSLKRKKIKTVSEKITETFLPSVTVDPEDDPESLIRIADLDDEDEAESFGVTSKPSEIRKRNAKLLSDISDKYKGRVTSRKELDEESDTSSVEEETESEELPSGSEDSELEEYKRKLVGRNRENKEESSQSSELSASDTDGDESTLNGLNSKSDGTEESSDGGDDNDESGDEEASEGRSEDEDDSDYASSANEESSAEEENTKLLSESNQLAAVEKGLAVQNQLKIWEKLLEIRIHSQKMSTKANSLPKPELFNDLCKNDEDFNKLAGECAANVERLLEKMLEMQQLLVNQFSEMKTAVQTGAKRLSNSIRSNSEPPVKRFAALLDSDFAALTPYRNSVLQKWDDRTKILTPGAGAKKSVNSFVANYDVIRKIEAVLMNKSDLVTKSRTLKGSYKLFGQEDNTENNGIAANESEQEEKILCSEIYDDTDFYHQQLRELIEYKSNTSANPAELTKQFAELQKLRQKMKKKVDTRASKGRKIRYVVHNKLVNFMAPNTNSDWTEESKSELYRSLFAT